MIKILIVEDESIVGMALKDMLKHLGYSVLDIIHTGEEAIQKAIDLQPDLILMDIKLKGNIDGIEAASKIRSQFDVPIIFITAYADEETVKRAKFTQPFAYIIKPFNELSLKSNIELTLHKYQLDKKLKENKKYLENIINSVSELLFLVDSNNKIITWNQTAEAITGFKYKELKNRSITDLSLFKDPEEFITILDTVRNGDKKISGNQNIIIISKRGLNKIINISKPSLLNDSFDAQSEVVIVGKDITSEMSIIDHISQGDCYLWYEKDHDTLINLLTSLQRINYSCLFISRSVSEEIRIQLSRKGNMSLLISNQPHQNVESISDLETLKTSIQTYTDQHEHAAIIINRIEFFILKYSFKDVILKIFEIADIIRANNSLLFIHINPQAIDEGQRAILEDEFTLLPDYQLEELTVQHDYLQFLNYLFSEKQKNHIVTYKKLKDEMKLTYPTISKKLQELENSGLVIIYKQGRAKIIEITSKGEHLIKQ